MTTTATQSIDLTCEHPAYRATACARRKSRDLYQGNDLVKSRKGEYLVQEQNEGDEAFARRLRRSVLDPYVEKIITARQALVFLKEPKRELPASLDAFTKDVDHKGTAIDTFFHDVARDAQIDGIHWVAVDMPKLPEGGYASKGAEVAAGHRPFLEHISACHVIDWSVGPDQKLDWIVVVQDAPQPREWGQAQEHKVQYKVWTRSEWYLYDTVTEPDAGGKQVTSFNLIDQGMHPAQEVPVVPFYGVKDSSEDFCGWPVAHTVLDHIILIYNKRSDLDHFERLAAHPIPIAISPEKPVKLDSGNGLWIATSPNGGQVDVKYLETNGNGFDSIRQSIADLREDIYAIALAQAKRDSAQVQAAESQREDRKIFGASLKTVSRNYESGETTVLTLVCRFAGETAEPKVTYSRDFDEKTIDATMLRELNAQAEGGRLSTQTLLQIESENELLPDSVDPEEEQKRLAAEQASAAKAALVALQDNHSQPAAETPPTQLPDHGPPA